MNWDEQIKRLTEYVENMDEADWTRFRTRLEAIEATKEEPPMPNGPFTVHAELKERKASWRGYYQSLHGATLGLASMRRHLTKDPWWYGDYTGADAVIRDHSGEIVHREPL